MQCEMWGIMLQKYTKKQNKKKTNKNNNNNI